MPLELKEEMQGRRLVPLCGVTREGDAEKYC